MTVPPDLVQEYLSRLERELAQHGCPDSRRRDILDEVRWHIAEEQSQLLGTDEASVRMMLDRLGTPEELAAEAAHDLVGPAPTARGGRTLSGSRRLLVEAVAAVAALATIAGLATSLATTSSAPVFSQTLIAPVPAQARIAWCPVPVVVHPRVFRAPGRHRQSWATTAPGNVATIVSGSCANRRVAARQVPLRRP